MMNGILMTNLQIGKMNEKQRIDFENYVLCESMNDKFREDKLFVETDSFICVIDGVILNKKELYVKYDVSSMENLISGFVKSKKLDFYNEFRGPFNGMLYVKNTDELCFFVDHYANKPLFYYAGNNNLVVSSVLRDLTDVLDINHISCTLNNGAVDDLLSYAFVIRNETILEEVKRIPAGCSMIVNLNDGSIREINRYHRFTQANEISVSEEEAVEEIDRLFRKAVSLEYEKDKEYGYNYLATLSAGLDSRMSNWVANDMGYEGILNLTFAQTGSDDMVTPSEIAERLNNQWLFKSLNDAKCMISWKKMIPLTNGLCNYWNSAHGYTSFELVDWKQFGLYHTGMIGDAIIGSHFAEKKSYTGEFIGGNTSLKWQNEELRKDNTVEDETEELYFFYGRALQGANAGCLPEYRITEVVSPFLYVDLVEYCYSLPQEFRHKHKIYLKWVLEKYPEAAEYLWNGRDIKEWAANGGEIIIRKKRKKKRYLKKFVREFKKNGLKEAVNQTFYKLGIKEASEKKKEIERVSRPVKWGMNPVDVWYEQKAGVRNKMDEYYVDSIKKYMSTTLPIDKIKYVYENGFAQDKAMCITVFAALDEFSYVIEM